MSHYQGYGSPGKGSTSIRRHCPEHSGATGSPWRSRGLRKADAQLGAMEAQKFGVFLVVPLVFEWIFGSPHMRVTHALVLVHFQVCTSRARLC